MYKNLYEPLPDLHGYLRRIGFAADSVKDPVALNDLIFSHLSTVPFENLDVYDGDQEPKLGIADLYDKIVTRRRGGFCFELNALFMSLLQALDISCYPVMAKVVWNKPFLPPYTHRATVAEMDGHLWFCDVGFGGPAPAGVLQIDTDEIQNVRGTNFRVVTEGEAVTVCREQDGKFLPLIAFFMRKADPVDFIPLSFHQSMSKSSYFRSKIILCIHTENGTKVIDGPSFREKVGNDVVREIDVSDPQVLSSVLETEFGVKI